MNYEYESESYLLSRFQGIPEDSDLSIYKEVNVEDIENYIQEDLMDKYNYTEDEIEYLIYFNQKVVLPPDYEFGAPINTITQYFEENMKFNYEEIKEILLQFPIFLRKDINELEERIKLYMDLGLANKKLERSEINDIVKANPFYLLCSLNNYPRFIMDFNHYGFK